MFRFVEGKQKTESVQLNLVAVPSIHPSLSSRVSCSHFLILALRAARAGYALSQSTSMNVLDSIICHGLLGQSWNDRNTGTTLNSSHTDPLRSSPKNRNERRAPEGENRACRLLLNISALCLDSICQEKLSYGMRSDFFVLQGCVPKLLSSLINTHVSVSPWSAHVTI